MNNHSWYAVLIYTIYLRTFCSLAVDLLETWAGKVRAKAAWAIPGIGQCTAPLWDSWWVLWSFSLEFLRSWWSELDEGWREICRKPLHLMVTTLISCRWSYCIINITKNIFMSIHWCLESSNLVFIVAPSLHHCHILCGRSPRSPLDFCAFEADITDRVTRSAQIAAWTLGLCDRVPSAL